MIGKFYKKVIDSVLIKVLPNADLEILKGIKKELEQKTEVQLQEEERPYLIFFQRIFLPLEGIFVKGWCRSLFLV